MSLNFQIVQHSLTYPTWQAIHNAIAGAGTYNMVAILQISNVIPSSASLEFAVAGNNTNPQIFDILIDNFTFAPFSTISDFTSGLTFTIEYDYHKVGGVQAIDIDFPLVINLNNANLTTVLANAISAPTIAQQTTQTIQGAGAVSILTYSATYTPGPPQVSTTDELPLNLQKRMLEDRFADLSNEDQEKIASQIDNVQQAVNMGNDNNEDDNLEQIDTFVNNSFPLQENRDLIQRNNTFQLPVTQQNKWDNQTGDIIDLEEKQKVIDEYLALNNADNIQKTGILKEPTTRQELDAMKDQIHAIRTAFPQASLDPSELNKILNKWYAQERVSQFQQKLTLQQTQDVIRQEQNQNTQEQAMRDIQNMDIQEQEDMAFNEIPAKTWQQQVQRDALQTHLQKIENNMKAKTALQIYKEPQQYNSRAYSLIQMLYNFQLLPTAAAADIETPTEQLFRENTGFSLKGIKQLLDRATKEVKQDIFDQGTLQSLTNVVDYLYNKQSIPKVLQEKFQYFGHELSSHPLYRKYEQGRLLLNQLQESGLADTWKKYTKQIQQGPDNPLTVSTLESFHNEVIGSMTKLPQAQEDALHQLMNFLPGWTDTFNAISLFAHPQYKHHIESIYNAFLDSYGTSIPHIFANYSKQFMKGYEPQTQLPYKHLSKLLNKVRVLEQNIQPQGPIIANVLSPSSQPPPPPQQPPNSLAQVVPSSLLEQLRLPSELLMTAAVTYPFMSALAAEATTLGIGEAITLGATTTAGALSMSPVLIGALGTILSAVAAQYAYDTLYNSSVDTFYPTMNKKKFLDTSHSYNTTFSKPDTTNNYLTEELIKDLKRNKLNKKRLQLGKRLRGETLIQLEDEDEEMYKLKKMLDNNFKYNYLPQYMQDIALKAQSFPIPVPIPQYQPLIDIGRKKKREEKSQTKTIVQTKKEEEKEPSKPKMTGCHIFFDQDGNKMEVCFPPQHMQNNTNLKRQQLYFFK